jgi:hypothetical protein
MSKTAGAMKDARKTPLPLRRLWCLQSSRLTASSARADTLEAPLHAESRDPLLGYSGGAVAQCDALTDEQF